MTLQDKRLIEKMNTVQQSAYQDQLLKRLDDAADKFEEHEIEFEPIKLLEKIKNRHKTPVGGQCRPATDVDDEKKDE